ncbi:hypothetical protein HWV62_30125 [Athelia sp. TMB]|nr:hypothetical protein HWV62_30125 [Athelia sp. TMB]
MPSVRSYSQTLQDWHSRLQTEPEWVQFEAEILIQCAAQDGTPEEVIALAFILQARAAVLQDSRDLACQLYTSAFARAKSAGPLHLPESPIWIRAARDELAQLAYLHGGALAMDVDTYPSQRAADEDGLAAMMLAIAI